jgi:hypothetical protein
VNRRLGTRHLKIRIVALAYPASLALSLLLLNAAPVAAQGVTAESFTGSLSATLTELTRTIKEREVGEALALNTSIEVATAPLGTSSGGFAFKLDKSTGLEVRTASTFGPSFAERVITSGAGKMSIAGSLSVASYDQLGTRPLEQMLLIEQKSPNPLLHQKGFMSLSLNSETTVIQAVMGATDNFDVGVAVPIVRVRMDAISWVEDENGNINARAAGSGQSTGLGDVALIGKYRFLRFGGAPPPDAPLEPDPGGFALMTTVRVPTGSRANLRGLGITRVLGSLVFSAGKGKFRPHGNVGYEWWSKGIDVVSDFDDPTVTARHSFQWAAGIELEATPKLTVMLDFLSRQINGGGKIGNNTTTANLAAGITSLDYTFGLPEGILKQSVIPGLKWNLKGSFLLSLNGVFSVRDNGLYDKFTPVVGLDWTF